MYGPVASQVFTVKNIIATSYYKYEYYVQNYYIDHNAATFLLNYKVVRSDYLPLVEFELE